MMKFKYALLVVACIAMPALASAAPAPKVNISSTKELSTPLPSPFDESANASAEVDAAFARARESGKRVLVDMGANWCGDCRILEGVLDRPEVRPYIDANFEVVHVNVGRFDVNQHIPARFHAQVNGIPWLVIAEPDETILVSSYDVTDGNHKTPQSMVDWIAQWTK